MLAALFFKSVGKNIAIDTFFINFELLETLHIKLYGKLHNN
jgi:hypothetical protein